MENKEQTMREALAMLSIAKCPNSNCDNNGTIAYQTRKGDWEPQQCEWCHRKKELLSDQQSLPQPPKQ